MAAPQKTAPDWERIESDYRAGILSLREIAAEHGITEGAVRKRAKRDAWVRDLSEKIQRRADDLVRRAEVRSEVRTESRTEERVLIESGAEAIAAVKLSHRRDIQRSRTLAMKLLDELEAQTDSTALFDELAELMRESDENGRDRMHDLYQKVISLPTRTKTMKDLADTLKTLVGLERDSYGISEAQKVELSGPGGRAIETRQSADLGKLTDEQLEQLEHIAAAARPAGDPE
ncbi:hypothetical protein [Microvirgula aerodenitrificans]|uniref:hypothetical protein n=1 Tax=Microvirgula aerodenitrificans TaxID=57480 RepID=UPI0028E64660|nr:hypothetical protein [Microvirgula aerodenitrificans]